MPISKTFVKNTLFLLLSGTVLCYGYIQGAVEKLSASLEVKRVYRGKSVTSKGLVCYESLKGYLVTKFSYPQEQIVISTASGEFKNYDVKNNTVSMGQGAEYSSRNSILHYVITGTTGDMGLTMQGYLLKNTRISNGLLIKTWEPKAPEQTNISKVELAFETMQVIYMGFYDKQNKVISKSFYTDYKKIENLYFPASVTEIEYLNISDSVVTRRIYSDFKVNASVDPSLLNFKIPANARVTKLDKQ